MRPAAPPAAAPARLVRAASTRVASARMGAWGAGAFDNDDAADWSLEFEGADQDAGLRLVTDALSAAAQAAGAAYLDVVDGSRAIAAAEVVASINGQPIDGSPYSETVREWINRARPATSAALTDLARQAVNRVTAAQNSEVAQLWGEAQSSSWDSVMAELRAKLDR